MMVPSFIYSPSLTLTVWQAVWWLRCKTTDRKANELLDWLLTEPLHLFNVLSCVQQQKLYGLTFKCYMNATVRSGVIKTHCPWRPALWLVSLLQIPIVTISYSAKECYRTPTMFGPGPVGQSYHQPSGESQHLEPFFSRQAQTIRGRGR